MQLDSTVDGITDPRQWVNKYANYLYSFALVRIGDQDLAKDLVQETFLAALEQRDRFEGRSSEKTWLTAILKNKIIDIYRSQSAGLKKEVAVSAANEDDVGFFDPDNGHWNDLHKPYEIGIEQPDALENKEFQRILQACMAKLPSLWSSVFTMKHIDQETTKKICQELKVSPANFWIIIHRTKINLRACLQKNWI
jgi:RNA polymerase sigma-70 factor (TIGR02943 family)